jgi:hypothetical protein
MNGQVQTGCVSATRVSAAEDIKNLCERMRDKANDLSKFAGDKLNRLIIMSPLEAEEGDRTKEIVRSYPEYFAMLKGSLDAINAAIDETRRTIQKVDI